MRIASTINLILNKIYGIAIRRNRFVKVLGKVLGRASIKVLSACTGFRVPEELSLGSFYMLLGTWEAGTKAVCEKYLKPGMIAIDIGAHVGYYSRIFSRCVGPKGSVVAFEPHPETYKLLLRNLKGRSNIKCINKAVSNKCGDGAFYEFTGACGRNSLVASRGDCEKEINVKTTTLDAAMGKNPVNLIKLDVEGGETEALDGMRMTISKSEEIAIVLEFYPSVIRSRGLKPEMLLQSINDIGFEICEIDEKSGEIHHVEKNENYRLFVNSIDKCINLWCVKNKSNDVKQK